MTNQTKGVHLNGLDGANPLGFLAALGTLRTLSLELADEKVEMSWEEIDGAWRPRIWCSLLPDEDNLMSKLKVICRRKCPEVFEIADDLNLPGQEFREHLIRAIQHIESLRSDAERIDVDFLAAFGSETLVDDKGIMSDTALRTMSGAGHQHFLKFMREIAAHTDADQLRRTLFLPWDYADEGRGMSLRWDPLDDRRYALRWDDPSGDPIKTMRGANRLAIESLPLFPTMPQQMQLTTTGFQGKGARDTIFTWPIWNVRISMNVVRSLLSWPLVASSGERAGRGVVAAYSCARITIGKFRNFTPAFPA